MTAYNDLVNVPSFGKRRENDFKEERGPIVFFCRDCRKKTEVTRLHPEKYLYECNVCKGRNIALGTESSIDEFYDRRK